MKTKAIIATLAMLSSSTWANNIQLSDLSLEDDTGSDIMVQFNITWENSWRTSIAPNNWDAAWVFVKYRDANTNLWLHAELGSDAQHSAPSGSTIATGLLTPASAYDASNNWGVGAFVYRSADGSGTFAANGAQLRWNYGETGITYEDIAEVKVFAVEMVYVPEGSIWVGDALAGFGNFIAGASTNAPFQITSEATLSIENTAGALWGTSTTGTTTIGSPGALPAAFPKGFAGFYCMKYSITQQQYVDFLNTLTRTQQNTRTGTNLAVGVTSVTNRTVMSNNNFLVSNGIRCDGTIDAFDPITFYCDMNGNNTGGEANDGQWIACNYLSWADVAAYLDWSGLRPMTELEYEKACRGPETVVDSWIAWGSGFVRDGNYSISDPDMITEGVSDPETGTLGNGLCGGTFLTPTNRQGRVGLFADGASTRRIAGAGYTGAMELSGNLWERTVTVGNDQGRAYTGAHGNGSLDASGSANTTAWPGTTGLGAGMRGGSWGTGNLFLLTASRAFAVYNSSDRSNIEGGRGVRSVP